MDGNHNGVTYSFDVCCQCGSSCCQDAKPPLSEKRKKTILQYLREQKISMPNPFTKSGYSYPSVDDKVFCGFYDKKTGKCIVHPVKPETCRAGPITFDINFAAGKMEWFLKKQAICSFAGVLYKDKEAFRKHFDVAREQLTGLISQLDPEELKVIVKIPEPETFKVGEDPLPPAVMKKLKKQTNKG